MPAGLSAVIVVLLTTVTLVAAVVPKSTAVAPVKPLPVIVTNVPPTSGPLLGLMPVTTVAVYAEVRSAGEVADLPRRRGHGHVHGAGARRAVGCDRAVVTTVTPVAATRAEIDRRGAVKPLPVIVTIVPPTAGPLVGLTPETVGRRVAEQIGGRGGRRAARRRHGHVDDAGARRADRL